MNHVPHCNGSTGHWHCMRLPAGWRPMFMLPCSQIEADACIASVRWNDQRFVQTGAAMEHAGTVNGCKPCPAADGSAGSAPLTGSKRRAASTAEGEDKKQRKGLYFEFSKKKWENEDSFKLPDGVLIDVFLAADSVQITVCARPSLLSCPVATACICNE
jgi:hypothetical protein